VHISSSAWISGCAQHRVDIIGYALILERQCVGVVPKSCRSVTMAEPLLGSERFPATDKEGGHHMAKAMETDAR
jgi:hypothetical protein